MPEAVDALDNVERVKQRAQGLLVGRIGTESDDSEILEHDPKLSLLHLVGFVRPVQ